MIRTLIFLFLIFSIPAYAVGDVTTINSDLGLDVRVAAYDELEASNTGQFSVHVSNRSTGLELTDSSTGCDLKLYDPRGYTLLTTELGYDPSRNQWNYSGVSGLVNERGKYDYIVQCNTSTVGGFYTGSFEVTQTGLPKNIEQVFIILGLFLSVILFALALTFKDYFMSYGAGMLFCIIGIYLFRFGYLGIQDTILEGVSIVLVGLGCYVLFRTSVEHLEDSEN